MNINDAIYLALNKYCSHCDKIEECDEACAEAADYFNTLLEKEATNEDNTNKRRSDRFYAAAR